MKVSMKIYLVPLISILILIAAFLFIEPTITGRVVFTGERQVIDADVTFTTAEGEIMPLSAVITVGLDDRQASMTVEQFVQDTPVEVGVGPLPGSQQTIRGLTGEHSYTIPLSAFAIDRDVEPGAHRLTTTISFAGQVLFEQESWVLVT